MTPEAISSNDAGSMLYGCPMCLSSYIFSFRGDGVIVVVFTALRVVLEEEVLYLLLLTKLVDIG